MLTSQKMMMIKSYKSTPRQLGIHLLFKDGYEFKDLNSGFKLRTAREVLEMLESNRNAVIAFKLPTREDWTLVQR